MLEEPFGRISMAETKCAPIVIQCEKSIVFPPFPFYVCPPLSVVLLVFLHNFIEITRIAANYIGALVPSYFTMAAKPMKSSYCCGSSVA